MTTATVVGATIEGIVTVVPDRQVTFESDALRLGIGEQQAKRIAQSVGLAKRHVAPTGVTAIDLAEAAVLNLLDGLAVTGDCVGALIFVTQTPDHLQPCNAAILHGRLGLGTAVCSFDINLGCSGYVYGLFVATTLARNLDKNVLLVVGDTLSRLCNPEDRSTAILFGDAASATLVSPKESGPMYFDLGTDGSGSASIIVPAGGARLPASQETAVVVQDADGNFRSKNDLYMHGGDVFNFASRTEPKAIKALLDYAACSVDEVDYFFLHQANRYIIQTIAKRLKIPRGKMPDSVISDYGNQSSASVPCAVNSTLRANHPVSAVLSGFGVGLSWGSVLCSLDLQFCPEPIVWSKK